MDDYFKRQYVNIKYPKESNGVGLRNAQMGAIHAISSYFTLQNKKPAIIIMPTGSGKTAVITMSPYVLSATKVLVVTPSRMVRGQITEEFSQLKTICHTTAADANIEKPIVLEMMHCYNEELLDSIENCHVVTATPQCALSLSSVESLNKLFDLVIIDEAHHTPAKTWTQILVNMKHAMQILFTATPFRMDQKEIKEI